MTSVPIVPGAGTVVLDGSGNGTVKLGPIGPREKWFPTSAGVSASSHVAEAACTLYVGDAPIRGNFRDATLSGSTGDSSGRCTGPIPLGWFVWAVWTGGDPGAVATLTVTGSKTI